MRKKGREYALALSLLTGGAVLAQAGSLFSSVVDGFVILFPAPPQVETTEVEVGGVGKASMRMYRFDEPKTEWLVSATDVARLGLDPVRTLGAARNFVVQNGGGRLSDERPLQLGGYGGVELRLERPDGSVMRTRICVTPQRILQAVVLTKEEWRRQAQIERFLESFGPE